VAEQFYSSGANVVASDVDGEGLRDLQKAVLAQVPQIKGKIVIVTADAGKIADCTSVVQCAQDSFGGVDFLFNNVGIQPPESMVPLHELKEEVWDRLMTVNLKSIFGMSRMALPLMIKRGAGVIVNNASIQGIQSMKNVAAYAATKGGILSLTRQLAVEYGQYGIRCNALSPGSTMTPLMERVSGGNNLKYVIQNTPMGRVGRPRDMAGAVLFLCSDEASWVTGQNLVVDGGITVVGGWNPLHSPQ
jgi:NAD(P)-dependent dehydrogenase (short-subunit alcohol dehydrogenase family)